MHLAEVLPRIPNDFPVPIVVVQHMPPIFTRLLAERLASRSAIPVEEGSAGVILTPGHAWIAPGNFHMNVIRAGVHRRLELESGTSARTPAGPRSMCCFAPWRQPTSANVLGVVMTGMGSDGVLGAQDIREAGGDVIIQDEASLRGLGDAWPGARLRPGRCCLSSRSVGAGDHAPGDAEPRFSSPP